MKDLWNRLTLAGISLLLSISVGSVVTEGGTTAASPKLLPEASMSNLSSASTYQKGYIWPTYGIVTSGFGQRLAGKIHTGIDIAGALGTPVWASASGVVVFAGFSEEGYGNLVTLRHDDGSLTLYGHNDRILVTVGESLRQGQQIATMGTTGNSTGPHLHFEIRPQGNEAINPRAFLPTQQPSISASSVGSSF